MEIAFTILMFVPLVVLLLLANLAERQRERGDAQGQRVLTIITYVLTCLMYAGLILLGGVLHISGLLSRLSLGEAVQPEAIGSIDATSVVRMGLGMWLPSVLGLVLLIPGVRGLFARIVPLRRDNIVDAVALSFTALILVELFVTLGMGLDNLASMLEAESQAGMPMQLTGTIWAQDITMAVMALVGVGWWSRRRLGEALRRLGVVAPSVGQALTGLGAGLFMVPLVLAVEYLSQKLNIGVSADVENLTEQVIGPLMTTIPGILTLGLAAALGEETVFRGALVPRFGVFLSALVFALVHSNYGISLSTLVVFIIGIVLALLRKRFNTSTSMIAHAVYNMSLGFITYLGLVIGS